MPLRWERDGSDLGSSLVSFPRPSFPLAGRRKGRFLAPTAPASAAGPRKTRRAPAQPLSPDWAAVYTAKRTASYPFPDARAAQKIGLSRDAVSGTALALGWYQDYRTRPRALLSKSGASRKKLSAAAGSEKKRVLTPFLAAVLPDWQPRGAAAPLWHVPDWHPGFARLRRGRGFPRNGPSGGRRGPHRGPCAPGGLPPELASALLRQRSGGEPEGSTRQGG